MKLNFKEWSIVLEALANKVEQIECNLRYYDEESETRTKYLRELETVKGVVAKIENFTI